VKATGADFFVCDVSKRGEVACAVAPAVDYRRICIADARSVDPRRDDPFRKASSAAENGRRHTPPRSAVEHVFAHQKGLMSLCVRTIGLARARFRIGLANLAYNMRRFVWLNVRGAPA
jgi:hypothetical protein